MANLLRVAHEPVDGGWQSWTDTKIAKSHRSCGSYSRGAVSSTQSVIKNDDP